MLKRLKYLKLKKEIVIIMRNRVAFIIPYFGKLPDMYYLWLKSAEAECNKIYDFKIYTDIAEINGNDKNIQVKNEI